MIPKIIHCTWFSGEEKPELVKRCMASWKEKLPDYEIREWSLKDVEEIRKQNPFLDQALNLKKWAFAADFLRLWILYNVGGIYLDTDVEVLKSFNPFLNNGFFTCYERSKAIEAAVMGSEKGNKFAKEFLDLYANRNFEEEWQKGHPEIVPYCLADFICKKYKKYKARKRHTIIEDLHIYPYQYFSPKDSYNGKIHKNKNTVCIHQFAGGWTKKNNKLRFKFTAWVNYVLRNILTYRFYRKVKKFLLKISHRLFGENDYVK